MPQGIKHKDIVSESLFAPTIKELEKMNELVKKIKADLPKGEDISLVKPESVENIKRINEEVKKTNKSYSQSKTLRDNNLAIQKKIDIANSKEGKALELQRQKLNALNKANREMAKEKAGLLSLYQKESRRLNELRKSYKDLTLSGKGSRRELRAMGKEITKLDSKLKRVDAKTGQYQRSVGNYAKGLGGLFRAAGLTLGIGVLIRGIRNVIGVFSDFQQANAKLASILGVSRKSIGALTDDAKRLGATTAFTASQVVELQTAFAKLGFSEGAILSLTESTINASIALGSNIGEQAEVTGKLLNAFGLEAAEAKRVNDLLAKSVTKTALDFEQLKDAFSFVAPTAKALGLTIEETAATLGVLVDNGIKGARAGRLLSSSFARLNKKGLDLEQAIQLINSSTDKTATATELFGVQSFTLGLILAENTEKTANLTEEFNKQSDAAKELAEEQLDTLQGSLTLLKSAWEGFVLSIENGDGIISKAIRGVVDTFKSLLTIWTDINNLGGVQNKNLKAAIAKRTNSEEEAFLERAEGWKKEGKSIDQIITRTKALIELRKNAQAAAKRTRTRQETAKLQGELKRATDPQERKRLQAQLDDEGGINSAAFGIATAKLLGAERVLKRLQTLKAQSDLDVIDVSSGSDGSSEPTTPSKKKKKTKDNTKELNKQVFAYLDAEHKKRLADEKRLKAIEKQKEKEAKLAEDTATGVFELDRELAAKRKKFQESQDEEERERLAAILQKRNETEAAQILSAAQALDNAIEESTNKRIRLIDREMEASKRRADLLKALAVQGNKDAQQSIALQEKRQAELEAKRERTLRRARRLEVLTAGLKTYSAKVEAGDPNALGSTIRDVGLLTTALTALGGFQDGTEFVGQGNQQMVDLGTSRDQYVTRLDKGERVLTREQNKAIGNIANEDLVKAVTMGGNMPANLFNLAASDNTDIISRLDKQNELLSANLSKATEGRDYDVVDNAIKHIMRNNNVTHTKKEHIGGIFGS